jgi:thioredoxin-related protein
MEKYNKKLEAAAYIAIIVMTLFTASIVIYRYLFQSSQTANSRVEKGFIVPTLGENWDTQERTVILALSTECRFCTENSDFYKMLVDKFSETEGIRIMAVFPQDKEISEQYLQNLGIKISVIKQTKLRDLGVSGTPTIILVDNKRKVVDSWVGKLDEKSQTKVIESIVNSKIE